MVSDTGEQWSPHTAPAITAERQGSKSSGAVLVAIAAAIGSIIPKVPQLVPVENAIAEPKMNNNTGKNCTGILPLTKEDKYLPVCISPTILLIVQAKNKIAMAPSIDLIPAIQARAYSSNDTWRSNQISRVEISTALEPPTTRDTPTLVFSKAPSTLNALPASANAWPPVYIIIETVTTISTKIGNTRLRTCPLAPVSSSDSVSLCSNAAFSWRAIEPISKEE